MKETKQQFLDNYWASIQPAPKFLKKSWYDAIPCPYCPDCGEWLLVFKADKKGEKND